MKIAVIGATGKAGNLIVQEALRLGHEVTAIVRNPSKVTAKNVAVLEKDIFNITVEDVKDFDVVVDAFRAEFGEEEKHYTSIQSLIRVFENLPNTRLMVVGGAGSLFVDSDKTLQVVDTEGFPEMFKPTATNMAKGLEALKASKVNWTYLSPSADFNFEGARTGKYTLGQDDLLQNTSGESYVSYADYALAMVDEMKNKDYVGKRFTVVSEKE